MNAIRFLEVEGTVEERALAQARAFDWALDPIFADGLGGLALTWALQLMAAGWAILHKKLM